MTSAGQNVVEKVRVGDIDIAYRWDGAVDGPVVMMAHAMGTSHRLWDHQVSALADRFRLLRYDWRGHGDTDAPPGAYTLDQFERDAVGLMDALGLAKVHWVGISTGGMIGQGLAINFPARIETLILCNTTSQSNPWYRAMGCRAPGCCHAGRYGTGLGHDEANVVHGCVCRCRRCGLRRRP